jgi:hypothetical protein
MIKILSVSHVFSALFLQPSTLLQYNKSCVRAYCSCACKKRASSARAYMYRGSAKTSAHLALCIVHNLCAQPDFNKTYPPHRPTTSRHIPHPSPDNFLDYIVPSPAPSQEPVVEVMRIKHAQRLSSTDEADARSEVIVYTGTLTYCYKQT